MPDINLTCVECTNPFYFTERDQEFYKTRAFQPPKRCFHCRQKRKQNSVNGPSVSSPQAPAPSRSKKRHRDDHNNDD